MLYAEALEAQVSMIRVYASERGQRYLERMWKYDLAEGLIAPDTTFREFCGNRLGFLGIAEPFYWAPPQCRLLSETAAGMPSWTLQSDLIPCRAAYFHFAAPLELPAFGENQQPLCGIGWRTLTEQSGEHTGREFIAVSFLTRSSDEPAPTVEMTAPWKTGLDWRSSLDDLPSRSWITSEISERHVAMMQALAAAFAFLNQRILIAPRERAERHARKRLERQGWTHDPLIRVVQFRRPEAHARATDGDAEPRDWSCQWIVRGHWRQQACGEGLKQRRPLWITPYVKGDPSKPLKPPRATIFAVTR